MTKWTMGPETRRRLWRSVVWIALVAGIPLVVAAVNVARKLHVLAPEARPVSAAAMPERLSHDPTKPTAVVVLGDGLTEASDFLAPYELLASSGLYNVYAIARERRSAALYPGEIAVLPHFSLAEYDERIGVPPAVIVVPNMQRDEGVEDPVLMGWIRANWQGETILLSICAGAYNLARAGITAGRRATSHQSVLSLVRRDGTLGVEWIDGVRWVDDGRYISSAGVSSGIDATLHLLRREHGADVALRVAGEIGYPHTRFLDDPSFRVPPFSVLPIYLTGAFTSFDDLGLVVREGASEIQLAALSDSRPRSYTARLRPVAAERRTVRTRHGLDLVPQWTFADAPRMDRILVVGGADENDAALDEWARSQGIEAEAVSTDGFAYDVALSDMAEQTSATAAIVAARGIEYPIAHLGLEGSPVGSFARPLALALLGLVIGMATLGRSRMAD